MFNRLSASAKMLPESRGMSFEGMRDSSPENILPNELCEARRRMTRLLSENVPRCGSPALRPPCAPRLGSARWDAESHLLAGKDQSAKRRSNGFLSAVPLRDDGCPR